jgi:hypothetical protein
LDRGWSGARPCFRSEDIPQSAHAARTANLNAANIVEKNHQSGLRHASSVFIQCGSIQKHVHDIAVLRVDLWRATGAQDAFVSPLNPGRLISCEQWS